MTFFDQLSVLISELFILYFITLVIRGFSSRIDNLKNRIDLLESKIDSEVF
ncbi:MAG: hypothetical protein PHX13_10570 [Thiovulaceae bacterium]|nr:hypothetical protein [Sulfurimonadaceae bacterium]